MHFGQAQAVSKKAAIKSVPVASPPTRRRRFTLRAAPKGGGEWRGFTGRTFTSKPLRFRGGSWEELSGLGDNSSPMGFEHPDVYTTPSVSAVPPSVTGSGWWSDIGSAVKTGLETVRSGVATYFDYKVQKTAADVAVAQLNAGQIPTVGVTPAGVNPGSPYYPYGYTQRTPMQVPVWVYAAGGGLLLLLALKRR